MDWASLGLLFFLTFLSNAQIDNQLLAHMRFENDFMESWKGNLPEISDSSPTFTQSGVGFGATFTKSSAQWIVVNGRNPNLFRITPGSNFSVSFWLRPSEWDTYNNAVVLGNKNTSTRHGSGFAFFLTRDRKLIYNISDGISTISTSLSQFIPNCRTTNRDCYMPFTEASVTYYECTTTGTRGSPPWCPTNANGNGNQWGRCICDVFNWVHVAVTNQVGGALRTYLNGTLIANVALSLSGFTNETSTTRITIGNDGLQSNSNNFQGSIDEVGIWNRVLTATEISWLFSRGASGMSFRDSTTDFNAINRVLPLPSSGSLTIPSTTEGYPLNVARQEAIYQSLFSTQDLAAAGLYPNSVCTRIQLWSATRPSISLENQRIGFSYTLSSTIASNIPSRPTNEIYYNNLFKPAFVTQNGWTVIPLDVPIVWNGSSILLEISKDNLGVGSGGSIGVFQNAIYASRSLRAVASGCGSYPWGNRTCFSSVLTSEVLSLQLDCVVSMNGFITNITLQQLINVTNDTPNLQYFRRYYAYRTISQPSSYLLIEIVNRGMLGTSQNVIVGYGSLPTATNFLISVLVNSSNTVRLDAPPPLTWLYIALSTDSPNAGYELMLKAGPPSINSLSPVSFPTTGGTITINGVDFGSSAGLVLLNQTTTCVLVPTAGLTTGWSDSVVTCAVPAGQGQSFTVMVITALNQSSNTNLRYSYNAPVVTAVVPSNGPTQGGTILTITGQNFGLTPVVTVMGRPCALNSVSHVLLNCVLPAGQGAGQLLVAVLGQSVSFSFAYQAPVITAITPQLLNTSGGQVITIQGSNLGVDSSAISVTVAGTPCVSPSLLVNHTTLSCILPPGAGQRQPVVAVVSGLSSSLFEYNYQLASITTIVPSNGPTSGVVLTLRGNNFGVSGTVTVGTLVCAILAQTNTEILCRLPQGTGANLSISFQDATLRQSQSPLLFSYDLPLLLDVTPTIGGTIGGVLLTLTGENFGQNAAVVQVGDNSCVVSFNNHSRVLCMLPPGQGSRVPVIVQVGFPVRVSNSLQFAYSPPIITTVLSTIPTSGGVVTLIGSNFGVSPLANFNGADCPVLLSNHSVLLCSAPAGIGLNLAVYLIAADQLSNVVNNGSYGAPRLLTLSPPNGPTQGVTLTLTGNNFGLSGTVWIEDRLCPIASGGTYSHTQIICTLPAGRAQNNSVLVRLSNQQTTNSLNFVYNPPSISSISPTSGVTQGQFELQINGQSFGDDINGQVVVGGYPCVPTVWSHSMIRCVLSEGIGVGLAVRVVTSAPEQRASGVFMGFSYASPTISSVSPNPAPTSGNVSLTIIGNNFGGLVATSLGVLVVRLFSGGKNMSCPLLSASHTQVVCILPAGEGTSIALSLAVINRSATLVFGYAAPFLSDFWAPETSTSGQQPITLRGNNFGLNPVVTINSLPCVITFNNHTCIICLTPAGSGSNLPVIVTVGGQTSNNLLFSYSPPLIESISPTNGPTTGGIDVTIRGRNLGSVATGTISIGGSSCPASLHQNTRIICRLPAGSGSNQLVVFPLYPSSSLWFRYDAPLVASWTSGGHGLPTAGAVPLTITGTNFATMGSVTIGSSSCAPIFSYNQTHVICQLPSGDNRVSNLLVITVNSQPSSPQLFVYDPPSITSITPPNGPTVGNIILTLNGMNFGLGGGVIQVGGQTCVYGVTQYSHTQIQCTLPVGKGRTQPVQLNTGLLSNIVFFNYNPPKITSISPLFSSTSGGNLLTINGNNFELEGIILIDRYICNSSASPLSYYSHTAIGCIIPSGIGANLTITVNVSGQIDVFSSRFSYFAPTISSVTPTTGPTVGAINITIQGQNLGLATFPASVLIFCNIPITMTQVWTHDMIIFSLPAATGPCDLTLSLASQNITLTSIFQYLPPNIYYVSGCEDVENKTINCPIDGFNLTLEGENFGINSSLIIVWVGNLLCQNVKIVRNHSRIQCVVETKADGNSSEVVKMQVNGVMSVGRQLVGYRAPVITAVYCNDTSAACQQYGQDVLINVTSPANIIVSVINLGSLISYSIRYGESGPFSAKSFTCQPLRTQTNGTTTNVSCLTSPGGGAGYYLQVFSAQQLSAESNVTLSYFAPIVLPNTIRTASSLPSRALTGTSSLGGDTIRFDVLHLGYWTDQIMVQYVQLDDGSEVKPCSPVSIVSNRSDVSQGSTLECRTSPGEGSFYQFRVKVFNQWSEYGADVFSYPVTPVIKAVTGCTLSESTSAGIATGECPTLGNIPITIYGNQFIYNKTITVFVGVHPCLFPSLFSASNYSSSHYITCILPSQTGISQFVTVIGDDKSSESKPLVSYGAPLITMVRGCVNNGNTTSNCPLTGGVLMTVIGTNFGAEDAQVFLAGFLINSTLHSSTRPHEELSFVLPAGSGVVDIMVLQTGGSVGYSFGAVAYQPCPAGTYQTVGVCSPCPPGTYTEATGSLSCKACTPGYFANQSQSTSCSLCANGYYSDDSSETECHPCPVGFYCVAGSVAPTPCPAGTFTNHSLTSICELCASGSYSEGGASYCVECDAGRFARPGSTLCTSCPSGTFQPNSSAATCLTCSAGYFSALPGQTACRECVAGFFNSNQRQANCLACSQGFFSASNGATACEGCAAGKYSGGLGASTNLNGFTACLDCAPGLYLDTIGQAVCQPCPTGKFSATAAAVSCRDCEVGTVSRAGSVACTVCAPGQVAVPALGLCQSCDPGTYSSTNSTTCSRCSVGRYQPFAAQNSCLPCPEGTVASAAGSRLCGACGTGLFSGAGASVCSQCVAGSSSPTAGAASCTSCLPGYFASENGAERCTPCRAGFFSPNSSSTACRQCDPGTFASAAQTVCSPCSPGSANPFFAAEHCVQCAPGEYSTGGAQRCSICDAGWAQPVAGQSACIACAPGTYTEQIGLGECRTCEPGRYANTSAATHCQSCTPGSFQTNSAQSMCLECEVGKASTNPAAIQCNECAPGSVARIPGSVACSSCPRGSTSSRGMTSCQTCSAGRFSSSAGNADCQNCPSGRYSRPSASTCLECQAGKYAPFANASSCLVCPLGRYSASGKVECLPCEVGSYSNAPGLSVCQLCDVGSYSPQAGLSACLSCTSGRYTHTVGMASCIYCPMGRFQNISASSTCVACERGRFSSADGLSASACTPCPVGRYTQIDGQIECSACEAGLYSRELGSSSCERCAPGKYGIISPDNMCIDCPTGTYQPADGQPVCLSCPLGTYSNVSGNIICNRCPYGTYSRSDGVSSCSECGPGQYGNIEAAYECPLCAPGTYGVSFKQSSCISCQNGKYQENAGRTLCIDCGSGSFSEEGASKCTLCAVGLFNPVAGQSACRLCANGTFASLPGAMLCTTCAAGSYSAKEGAKLCDMCGPGKHAPQAGAITCQLCAQGYYQDEEGAISCLECEQGRVGVNEGSSACLACQEGTYQDSVAMTNCTICPSGYAQPSIAKSTCLQCSVGRYNPVTEQSRCLDCDAGTFTNQTAATTCLKCPLHTYQPATSSSSCLSCPRGTEALRDQAVQCSPCPPGKLNPWSGQACQYCPAGYYQDQSYATTCFPCTVGRFSREGATSCTLCTPFSVAPLNASASCYSCLPLVNNDVRLVDVARPNGDQSDCLCIAGYFLDNMLKSTSPITNLTPSEVYLYQKGQCQPCPIGTSCLTAGVTRQTLETARGWWRSPSQATLTFYKCLNPSNCLGGVNSTCDSHRAGPICAFCMPGYESTTSAGACTQCPAQGGSAGYSVFIVTLFLVVGFCMYYSVLKHDDELVKDAIVRDKYQVKLSQLNQNQQQLEKLRKNLAQETLKRNQRILDAEGILHASPNFNYKLKIFLGFFQIASNFSFALEVPWPKTYRDFMSVFSLANFDFITWARVGCIVHTNFYGKWLVMMVLPPAILLLVVLLFVLPVTYKMKTDMSDNFERRLKIKSLRRRFGKLTIFTLFLMYPTVSSTSLRLYTCRKIANTYYLLSDFTLTCYNEEWRRYAVANIPFLLSYPLGIPLLFAYLLYRNRYELAEPKVRLQFGFLYDGYSIDMWWFEMVDMAHKLLLTGLLSFLPLRAALPLAMLISVSYTVIILLKRPYLRKGDDRLHLLGQIELYLLILAAYIAANSIALDTTTDTVLSFLLISLTVFLMCVFIYQVSHAVRKLLHQRVLRKLKKLEMELALEDGHAHNTEFLLKLAEEYDGRDSDQTLRTETDSPAHEEDLTLETLPRPELVKTPVAKSVQLIPSQENSVTSPVSSSASPASIAGLSPMTP